MAYDGNKLSLVVQTIENQTPAQWTYLTSDSLAAVLATGYLSDATKRNMRVGDFVSVVTGTLNTAVYGNPSTADVGEAQDFSALPSFAETVVSAIVNGAATLQPAAKQTVLMPLQLADIAAGTFKIGMPAAFQVISALWRTAKPASTAAKAATLTVGISGVAVTGGVMALTTANQNAIGGAVAASAITGANIGAAGATLELAASAVTAFAEGDGWAEIIVATFGNG